MSFFGAIRCNIARRAIASVGDATTTNSAKCFGDAAVAIVSAAVVLTPCCLHSLTSTAGRRTLATAGYFDDDDVTTVGGMEASR